jgi:tRNA(Arg) A34 adenosine deaminase TadA
MQQAIELARRGIKAGQSPFGAVIATQDGKVIQAAHNRVRAKCDSTAHAEIEAIRAACARLGTIDLSDFVIAATCEPCPMCAGAIHWARLDTVIYGADMTDAEDAGFNELSIPIESLFQDGHSRVRVCPHVLRGPCVALFEEWKRGPTPNPY